MVGLLLFMAALAASAFFGNALLGLLENWNRSQAAATEDEIRQQVAASELRVDAEFTKARAAMRACPPELWGHVRGT